MPAKVGYIVVDTVDPESLAGFWCSLLAVEVDATIGDGQFLVLSPTEDGITVGFQRVAEAKAAKNRLHLDLFVNDLDIDVLAAGSQTSTLADTIEARS